MRKLLAILILLLCVVIFAQETAAQKELLKKAEENFELLNINPEKAFHEAIKIEKEAQRINAKKAELQSISLQCHYYQVKGDFDKLLISAKYLYQKADNYHEPVFQSVAHLYLFTVYILNNLHDKALISLESCMEFLEKADENDDFTILVKSNLFISYANYYSHLKDSKNELKYLKLSGVLIRRVKNIDLKNSLLFVNYSNMAGIYYKLDNIDSVRYYVNLSISTDQGKDRNDIRFINLFYLGIIAKENGNFSHALSMFRKSENLKIYSNPVNLKELYDNILDIYKQAGNKEKIKEYEKKKDLLELAISENKNKTLHNIIKSESRSQYIKFLYPFGILATILIIYLSYFIRKSRVLAKQEKESQRYLNKISENRNINDEDYSKLYEMLKKNDLAFSMFFNEVFPDFSSKLININPNLSSSEIEFCALIKLKLPTKDIARHTYTQPQSVRNKKHLMRKKLFIPKEQDIYQFVENI